MVEKLEALAELSVARGCGFAAIGILTLMVGLSYQMSLALKAGGIMGLGLTAILVARAIAAPRTPYKRTEVWIMLDPAERPGAAIAQMLIGRTLRHTYLRYALNVACISAGFLTSSLILSLLGTGTA